ncbi:MAG: hypothetical protein U0903_18145 [Planctomycetales bacterium]
MPLALCNYFEHPQSRVENFSNYPASKYAFDDSGDLAVTGQLISEIRVGSTRYHLFNKARTFFSPPTVRSTGKFIVDDFSWIVGEGGMASIAKENWQENFHSEFQRLYFMRPFEMNATDREQWKTIQSKVDVERFRVSQPLSSRRVGRVVKARPLPEKIRWEDGSQEKIDMHSIEIPPEFARFKRGDQFEAVVLRNPITYKILKITYLNKINEVEMTKAESDEIWESTSRSTSLPETTWD